MSGPGEMVYPPRPSWAPIFLAIGTGALACGVFAAGFIFSPVVYAVVGLVFVLAAFRSLVRGSVHGYFRLSRKQRVRSAALPVETIDTSPRSPK
jgi:hypothetical protein